MRLSTGLALLLLLALGVWSQWVLDRPWRDAQLANGVARVIDGDSLRLGNEEIRLKGIDAPEYDQTCRHGNQTIPCGRQAAAELRRIVARAPLTCTGHERDRYGRLLATCRSLGVDIAAHMVRSGMAMAFGDYFVEEAGARNAMAGFWAGSFEPPSDWRARHPRESRERQPPAPAAAAGPSASAVPAPLPPRRP